MSITYKEVILSGLLSNLFYIKILTNMIRILQNFFVKAEFDIFKDKFVDFEIKKSILIIGFIVKEFNVSLSSGYAPDLLLQHQITGEIIPVEIKVLKSNSKNSDYYRALHIVTLQCHNVKDIL
jgi:hypothetical protein